MTFGMIIIGDEILSGRCGDKHLHKLIEVLGECSLALERAEYVGDEPARITNVLRRTFASDDMVFCTGDIGATSDNHTRQCAAAALGAPLELHPETREQITLRIIESANGDPVRADVSTPESQHRFKMSEFPQDTRIVSNSYSRIPGSSIAHHRLMPGFPMMAWPMVEWVLDAYYADRFHRALREERSFLVFGLPESRLTPLMERIRAGFDGVKVFSLPSVGDAARGKRYAHSHIDLDVKSSPEAVTRAYAMLRKDAMALGGKIFGAGISAAS